MNHSPTCHMLMAAMPHSLVWNPPPHPLLSLKKASPKSCKGIQLNLRKHCNLLKVYHLTFNTLLAGSNYQREILQHKFWFAELDYLIWEVHQWHWEFANKHVVIPVTILCIYAKTCAKGQLAIIHIYLGRSRSLQMFCYEYMLYAISISNWLKIQSLYAWVFVGVVG